MQEPQPLEISARARKALDSICDTFVPGEEGLPSATDRGVPEAMLMAVGSSPSKAERDGFAGLLDAWDTELAGTRAEPLLVAAPRPSASARCSPGRTRRRWAPARASRRSARASC